MTARATGDGQVSLSWETPADDRGSTIIRYEYTTGADAATSLWIPIPGSNRNSRGHTVTGLTNGTDYQFRVRAVSSAGNGDASTQTTPAVSPSTVPAPPRNLKAVPANSAVGLYWDEVATDAATTNSRNGFSRILQYEYRQKTGSGEYSPWTVIIGSGNASGSNDSNTDTDFADPLNDPDFKVTGLTNGTTYQFQVRARNDNGAGAASETQPVTTATEPGRPRSLTAVAGNGQVTLSWTASSNGGSPITSWQLRQDVSSGDFSTASWVVIPGSNADTTNYTVTGLNNANSYHFEVRAVNAIGAGIAARSSVVDPGMAPGQPTGLTGTARATSVTLVWTPPLNAAGDAVNNGGSPIRRYEYSQKTGDGDYGEWMAVPGADLYQAPLPTDGSDPTGVTDINTRILPVAFTVSGLTPGTAYTFRVRAVNDTGAGLAFIMSPAPAYPGSTPPAPGNLSARPVYDAASGTATVALSWASGGDGGSPITHWQYKFSTGLDTLGAAPWVNICDNSQGRAPTCASTSSVTLPRTGRSGTFSDSPDNTDAAGNDITATRLNPSPGDTVYFVVRARNAIGTGDGFQSGTDSATFALSVPSAPRAVYIQTTDGTVAPTASPPTPSITVSWAASATGGSAITAYQYAVKTGSGPWSAWMSDTTPTNTTVVHSVAAGTPAGTPHQFMVRAVNRLGAGASTESKSVAAGAPGSPGALDLTTTEDIGGRTGVSAATLTAVPGVTQVALDLSGTTGAAIATTRWEYSYKVGDGEYGQWAFVSNASDFNANTALTVDGLENGVRHTFRIRALNGQLSSPILEASPVTPGIAPPAPQGLTASAGHQSVTLSWTSGGSGGPPITEWHYCTLRTSTPVPTDPANPTVVTRDCLADEAATATGSTNGWFLMQGSDADTTTWTIGPPNNALVNGTTYTYLVRAKNNIGAGLGARAQANPATPGQAPSAPVRVIVDSGDAEVTITVTVPSNNNGSPVVAYQVRKSMSGGPYDAWESLGTTASRQRPTPSAQNGATVTGLTNGASYTFQVRAVNAFGPGPEIESAAVTPVGAPTAGELGADPGDGQVALSWSPTISAGSAITKWQYRQSESGGGYGAWTDIAGSGPDTASHVVTGLDNGTTYTFQVRAVSAVSTGVPITSGAATPGTVPAAPSVNAARGNGQVDLSWTAGTAAGAGPTTGWQVRTDDGEWMDVDGADTSSYSVTGLMNGTAYTFEVRAVNSFGAGEAGSASATPATTPSAPSVSAMRGDGSTAVSWTAGDDGGSAVTGWQVQVNGGGWTDVMADSMSVSVDTDDGTAYTFEVRGVNDVGEGAAGSAMVEAGSTPAAPTVTATGGDGSITVSWTAGDDGGSSITGWQYRQKVSIGEYGDWMDVSADTMSLTISDLGSGTGVLSYTYQVRGVNGVGEGAAGTSNEAFPVADRPADDTFYSGVITGPDFCTQKSLGGARLFAHDGDGDGVADVCSLPYTRREAIARQNAVEDLAFQYADEYLRLVNAACAITEGDAACGGDTLSAPPPIPADDGGPYYSGVITGPTYCANRSLGGQATYPHDNDKDGVAEVCSYAYSVRESAARQLAGDILAATYPSDFRRELASACRRLTGANYGDDPADLARDACA